MFVGNEKSRLKQGPDHPLLLSSSFNTLEYTGLYSSRAHTEYVDPHLWIERELKAEYFVHINAT